MTLMKIDDLIGPATPLAENDVLRAAKILGVSVAKVRAVCAVESNGRGFHPDSRRPIILFEPHVFSRGTGGKFDVGYPDISYPKAGTKPYPASQRQRWEQLAAAMRLAEGAALGAASWGLFQIMGFNFKDAGFDSVQGFVLAMCQSEGEHLAAFARLVTADREMHDALVKGDWAGFARLYNGTGYAKNSYDQKLKAAFAKYRAQA